MSTGYNYINPDDFEVRDVIKAINSNLEFVYENQISAIPTVLNLMPYSTFSIITNVDYWEPYERSNVVLTDNRLVAYSSDSTVGVISPALSTAMNAGDLYTLSLKCKINSRDALLNEFFVIDHDGALHRLNHEESIPFGNEGYVLKTFSISTSIENPRFVIGSSDVENDSLVNFEYIDRVKESLFVHNGLTLPYIDTYKAKYDRDEIPIKNTLHYLLVNFNHEVYSDLPNYFVEGKVASVYNIADGSLEVTTLVETFLYHLVAIRVHLGDTSYHELAERSVKYIATRFNVSPIKGLFQLNENSTEYSLRLSLIALDIINTFLSVHDSYSDKDLNGVAFDIIDMRDTIVNKVKELAPSISDTKYLKGGIKDSTYVYINTDNTLSSSEIDIVNQLELYRLLLTCGVSLDYNSKVKSMMSYEFQGFNSTYLMPNRVKSNDYLLTDTILSVEPCFLYFNLLKMYPTQFKDANLICEDILKSLMSLKSNEGFYKYDYSVGGYVYSSSQYLESYLHGFPYKSSRMLTFSEISLSKGRNASDVNIITPTNGESISRVEFTVKRVDTSLNPDDIKDIVSDSYVSKDSFNTTISNINQEIDKVEQSVSKDSIQNVSKEIHYTKQETDSKFDDSYVYINTHIQTYETETNQTQAVITELQSKVQSLETNQSVITELQSKVQSLETTIAELRALIESYHSADTGGDTGEGTN